MHCNNIPLGACLHYCNYKYIIMTFACYSLLITAHAGRNTWQKQSIMCRSTQVKEVKSLKYYWTTPSKGHSVLFKQVKPISHTILLIPAIIVGNAGSQNVINIWWPFPMKSNVTGIHLHSFIVFVTNDSDEVYYVSEMYEGRLWAVDWEMTKWESIIL